MIYGFAYLGMVLAISAGWVVLSVLRKPDFIDKPLNDLKNKIRPFLNQKRIMKFVLIFHFFNWINHNFHK